MSKSASKQAPIPVTASAIGPNAIVCVALIVASLMVLFRIISIL